MKFSRKFQWPHWHQWKQLPQILTRKERYIIVLLFVICITSGTYLFHIIYRSQTIAVADYGGRYTEAIIGIPQFINPIFADASNVDRDMSSLIYSGLFRYNTKGKVVLDLAEKYELSEDKKTYTIYLKKDILWHDGESLRADDVLFTLTSIIDQRYDSPLKQSWGGVEIQKKDDYTITITTPNPYAQFIEKMTVGILPVHIWGDIKPQNMKLAQKNLNPIGSGPFLFEKFEKDASDNILSMSFEAYDNYHDGKPFINNITFYFFQNEQQAIRAYQVQHIDGISYISSRYNAETLQQINIYPLRLPKYFAVFFNAIHNKILANKNIRMAIALATNKKEIQEKIFKDNVALIASPILPWLTGYNADIQKYKFNIDKAKILLKKEGWKDINEDGLLEKNIEDKEEPSNLNITIAMPDIPDLIQVGEILKAQWRKIGIHVILEKYSINELKQEIIKPRRYDALLFGEVLTQYPDLYAFWHSSQTKDPGLNLALYTNKKVDILLEELRQTFTPKKTENTLKDIQQQITDDIPALFLFSPYYMYAVNQKIKNILVENINTPTQRFVDIHKWYIKTKRIKANSL